jgi:RHH-type rel operon transcriptional repressor/antitoxin RelB
MSSVSQKAATMNDWQIQEIHSAVAEADTGDFATDSEVKAVMDKWNTHAE